MKKEGIFQLRFKAVSAEMAALETTDAIRKIFAVTDRKSVV